MTIDPLVVQAIMSLVTGGVAAVVTQLLKNLLKLEGAGAVVLTGVVCVACTAIYFLIINPPFVFVQFLMYAVVVVLEATGVFHFASARSRAKKNSY